MSNIQIVSDSGIQWSGNTGTLVVKYNSNDATTTGLGLRIHYDNASMALVAVSDLLTSDNISPPQLTPYSDSENIDDNPATDSYVTSNWASLFGSWPGSTEADLVTLTFEKVDGGSENYDVGYTASSTAAGFEFNPQPMSVSVNDVDENSGAGQVIATVKDAPEGATYSLVDNTAYPVDDADAPAETQINIPDLQPATQYVYASDAAISEDGSQLTVVVSYGSQDSTLTGLGLRVHYDNTTLTLADVSDLLVADNISAPQLTPTADSGNSDGDATTDSYVTSNWASLFGSFPGSNNVDLVTLTFDIAEGAEGPTAVNFSAASNAAGNAFVGQDQIIQLPVAPVDPSELSIDAATGAVTLDVNPDYEARSEYSFDVIANVGGAEETASATFSVGNADELAPVFDSGDSAGSIDENSGAGQVIYTAAAHDNAADATSEPLSYSLAAGSDAAVSIDSATGEVTLAADPNFEAQSAYSFAVVATDGAGNSAEQSVTLNINNLDDAAPVITSGDSAGSIDENSGAGQAIYTAVAADNAADVTSEPLTYSLSDDSNGAVAIDSSTGVVTLSDNPDFEANQSYSFTVVATDGAGNSADQSVTLGVNNLDDSAPIFVSSATADGIDENSGAGQVVYTAQAQDNATDVTSAPLAYSLSDDSNGAFSIDSATGAVTLSDNPDFEAVAGYSFTVVATDGAGNAAQQTVSLAVVDIFDLNPVFDSSNPDPVMNENGVFSYTAVADVDPRAADYGIGPDLAYSLSDDGNGVFGIDSATGVVSMSVSPNYEAGVSYGFTVVATDDNGNSSENAVSLTVNNVDELAPIFASDSVVLDAIDENSGEQVVYSASATDDSNDVIAGSVTYSLAASNGPFSIDSVTGAVTLGEDPDFEGQSEYSFTVTATDGAGNSSEQSVTLPVANLDELAPIFDSGDTATAIDENTGAAQVVYTASANDNSDDVTSDPLAYSLSDDSNGAFSIDSASGAVTLVASPDFESAESYSFTVVATDAVGNSASQAVSLSITNLDDTAPIFDSADSASIDENAGSNQLVYTAQAHDNADDVTSEPLTYSLSDDSNGLLSIDGASGEVTLSEDPNFEATEGYSFTVVATDGEGNATSQQVSLSVTNLDDTAPIIEGTEVALTLSSFSSPNQTVYAPVNDSSAQFETAYDDASDVTSEPLTFSLAVAAEHAADFAIDANTGAVTYIPVPYTTETLQTIDYAVTATDGEGNQSTVDLQLNISGKEFNAPLFSAAEGYATTATDSLVQNEGTEYEEFVEVATAVSGTVSETVGDGDVVYTAVAADATPVKFTLEDSATVGENSGHNQIIYNAVSTGNLSIDENTGAVTLVGAPSAERGAEYNFTVIATDSSDNQSAQSVSFTIDNFDAATAAATDATTYSLVEGHDEALEINAQTGEVALLENPDHEAKSEYSFVIEATDGAGNVRQQAVTVTVDNVDDVAPTVTSGDTAAAIDENSGAGQVVYTATADDSIDPTSSVAFSLAADSDPALSIDAATGEVALAGNPDHEAQSEYSFTVVATDGAGNASEQAVTLQVNDLDEITPIITSDSSSFSIEENTGVDQVVYTATAHDAASFIEKGPIAQQFERNDDGTLTLKLFVDESVAANYPNGLEAIQFAVNYAGEESGVFSVNSITFPSAPLVPVAHQDNGQINFALIYMSPDLSDLNALKEANLYDTSGNTPIAEINFNIGDASVAGEFSVSEVGLSEYGYNMTYPVGQSVHQYTLNGSGDTTFSLSEDSDSALTIDSATGEVTLAGSADHEAQSEYSFTVIATDAAGNSAEEAVAFSVTDLDELASVFVSGDSASVIAENSGAGQVIYTAEADDSADISGGVTYTLSADSDSALSIDQATGEVTLADSPDYEAQSEYGFTVVATDAAGHVSQQAVTLDIADLDEVAATITSGDTATAIDENSGAAQVVYTATADDSADTSDGVSFSLAAGTDAALSIDAASGEVTLLADPDHEAQSEYGFTVVATDAAGNASQQAVSLAINDLDEVSATITSGDVAVTIDENSGADQVVYTATSDDSADVSDGISFSLAASSDAAFSIDAATGEVSLATNPDYETQNQYSFTVVATDAAGNSKEQAVSLSVADKDEVAPTITSVDTVSITENTGIDQVIYTATADDSADVSGGVTFSLADDSDAGLEIDAQTGDVTLLKNPDVEAQSDYDFTVVATDAAGNASAQAVVLNVDPVTTVNITHWASNVRISDVKIKQGGVEIGRSNGNNDKSVFADARDQEFTAERDVAQNDTDFVVDAADALAALKLAVKLPGSAAQSSRTFVYKGENDYNGDGQVTDADFQMNAADVNRDGVVSSRDALQILRFAARMDNAFTSEWVFVDTGSEAAGDESTPEDTANFVGLVLGDIDGSWSSAETEQSLKLDKSISSGDTIYKYDTKSWTFNAEASGAEAFEVNARSGQIKLNAADQSEYGFVLINNRTGEEKVFTVDVPLADEVAPDFASAQAVAVEDNIGNNKVVYSAVAVDGNGGKKVLYSLGDDAPEGLSINHRTGNVRLQGNTDHSAQSEYAFTVVATDSDGNASEQLVTLSVLPAPDVTAPTITSGDLALTIAESSGANQEVYAAAADDADVTYSLAAGSDAGLSIDSSTGKVELIGNPNAEDQSEYSFTVVATDTAGNASEREVTLSIDNLDEIAPKITSGSGAVVVENSGADQVVYTVDAVDNEDVSGGISYSLSADSDAALSIDASGAVTLAGNPDYEAQSEYDFAVIATDAAGNASAQEVTLQVKNVDDIAPVITSGDVAETVNENGRAGKVIYTATADDSADSSGRVTYSLAEGSDSALSINANSGRVRLAHSPDAEGQDGYTFTVVATDKAGNSSEQVVTLSVDNVDEVAPTITSSDSAGSVDENSGAAQVIYTATTTADGSVDASGDVAWSLAAGSDAALSIDASGAVTLNANPDQETQSEYSFTVVATDAAGNASEQSVALTVNDLDEAAPTITSGDTAGSIAENSGAAQVIYSASASDSADISGGVTLSLAEGSDPALSINANGDVVLADNPDFEAQSVYSFTVVATDAAGYATSKDLTVSVDDLDEVAPTITSGAVALTLDENSGHNQLVYAAQANDSADVSNGDITYSLADGHNAAIAINADTGEVFLLSNPDHELYSEYSFTVITTDTAGNASEGQTVTLSINDLDEISPTITSAVTVVAKDENSGAAQVIYTATADDSLDISADVTFSLAGDSDAALSIDADTGAVTLSTDLDYETQSTYSFTVVATDGINPDVQQSYSLDINDLDEIAPTITSVATVSAIDENSGAQVIYTATADDSLDTSAGITFSLSSDSDAALSIDSATGVVSLNADPDHEAQSEYSFTVLASDGVNADVEQALTLDINDLDEVAPQLTSTDSVIVTEGVSELYTATADDAVESSGDVSFSLAAGSDAALSIDAATGAVSIDSGASAPGYSFTVVATDGSGNETELPVSVAVADVVSGVSPTVSQGDIEQRFTQNSDGSITLQLLLNETVVTDAVDFELHYNTDDLVGGAISASQIAAPSGPVGFTFNEVAEGQIAVGQMYFPAAFDAASGLPVMEVTFELQAGVTATSFEVTNIRTGFEETPMDGSTSSLNIAVHTGTDGADVFTLEGGVSNVQSGAGSDIFIATDQIDSSVLIDFESGVDSIEMSQLLEAAGYTDADSVTQVSGATPDIADLIAGNDGSLDSTFGGYLDDSSNILTLFVDADSSAGAVDMQAYEITLGDGATVEDEDLSVTFSAFIA